MPQKTIVMLFTYGGGMRGLVPARIMAEIEKRTGRRMADHVDIFCGPSTGAILNAALNVPHPDNPKRPKYSARHMIRFYQQDGIKIFPPDRFRDFRALVHDFNNRTMKIGQLNRLFRHGHYDPKNLGHSLTKLYGTTKLKHTLKSLVIPTYNIDGEQLTPLSESEDGEEAPVQTKNNFVDEGGHAVWLKNIKIRDKIPPAAQEVSLKDAVMASCAAPTYFPCHHFTARHHDSKGTVNYTGIDGSLFDNPCISYYGAVQNYIPEDARLVVILLGTGYTLKSINRDQWNTYGGLGVVDPVNDLPLINIMFHAPESALVENFTKKLGPDLFVFNKSIVTSANKKGTPSLQIDDASETNLKAMKIFAKELAEEKDHDLDRLCQILMQKEDAKTNRKSGFFSWLR